MKTTLIETLEGVRTIELSTEEFWGVIEAGLKLKFKLDLSAMADYELKVLGPATHPNGLEVIETYPLQ